MIEKRALSLILVALVLSARLVDRGTITIGTAFFDRGRCLPWAMETPCVVCEEVCPVSPKADIQRA